MSAFQTTSLAALIDRYDTFLVDQYGVLRDANGLYPGAVAALAALRAAGRTVVVLSNSGQDGAYNAARMRRLGLGPDLYTAFVTSGDAALALFAGDDAPLRLEPGARCLAVTSGDRATLADRLGLACTQDGREADLVLIAGSEAERIPLQDYALLLRPAAERGVPAVCTNPDIEKLTASGKAPGAGAIAALYESLGGTVIRVGKPHPAIYAHAHARVGQPPKAGIVCVGDSLVHDVVGARDFGVDAALVDTGLAAGRDRAALAAEAAALDCAPRWLLAGGFRP